ncbi:MAG: DUF2231 domain-containing protein [Chloroflexota bacterium]|nr:DUF2231 domain-containing protein [Chloroflexota bacterium]
MPKTTFAGHALHPQLINAPAALLPFSLVLDLMHAATSKPAYAEAAYYSMVGGYVGGLAAATAGAGDYFAIPSESHTKRIANIHASLNLSLLGLYSLNLLLRRGKTPPTGTVPVALSTAGTVGLLVSAWYGGHMVYSHGMRVKGVSPVAEAPELKLPGDKKLEEAFSRLEQAAPEKGPQG